MLAIFSIGMIRAVRTCIAGIDPGTFIFFANLTEEREALSKWLERKIDKSSRQFWLTHIGK